MPTPHFDPSTLEVLHFVFTWTGFGTLVGLTAKAIMPGKDPGGAAFTSGLGLAGGLIGNVVLSLLTNDPFELMTPYGVSAAIAGAFILLFVYRISDGKFWEDEEPSKKDRSDQPNPFFGSPFRSQRRSRRAWQADLDPDVIAAVNEERRIERTARDLLRDAPQARRAVSESTTDSNYRDAA